MLRKKNAGKIYSCFSRHGKIFYKLRKDSQPKILTCEEDIVALASKLGLQVPEDIPSVAVTNAPTQLQKQPQSGYVEAVKQVPKLKPQVQNQHQRCRQSDRLNKGYRHMDGVGTPTPTQFTL